MSMQAPVKSCRVGQTVSLVHWPSEPQEAPVAMQHSPGEPVRQSPTSIQTPSAWQTMRQQPGTVGQRLSSGSVHSPLMQARQPLLHCTPQHLSAGLHSHCPVEVLQICSGPQHEVPCRQSNGYRQPPSETHTLAMHS